MGMGNDEVIKNLKIGIMRDLHTNGLISQKQMEQAIFNLNREWIVEENDQTACKTLDVALGGGG